MAINGAVPHHPYPGYPDIYTENFHKIYRENLRIIEGPTKRLFVFCVARGQDKFQLSEAPSE